MNWAYKSIVIQNFFADREQPSSGHDDDSSDSTIDPVLISHQKLADEELDQTELQKTKEQRLKELEKIKRKIIEESEAGAEDDDRRAEISSNQREAESSSSSDSEPTTPQLSEDQRKKLKNRKRKLKKKRREQQLKAEGLVKPKAKVAIAPVTFTYEPAQPKQTSEKLASESRFASLLAEIKRQSETATRSLDEVKGFFTVVLEGLRKDLDFSDNVAFQRLQETDKALQQLFISLESPKFPKNIKDGMLAIKRCLLSQKFTEADQTYISITVGNAPWPTTDATLLMNDEEKRKSLQAVKRLMTFWRDRMAPRERSMDEKWDEEHNVVKHVLK